MLSRHFALLQPWQHFNSAVSRRNCCSQSADPNATWPVSIVMKLHGCVKSLKPNKLQLLQRMPIIERQMRSELMSCQLDLGGGNKRSATSCVHLLNVMARGATMARTEETSTAQMRACTGAFIRSILPSTCCSKPLHTNLGWAAATSG